MSRKFFIIVAFVVVVAAQLACAPTGERPNCTHPDAFGNCPTTEAKPYAQQ